MLTFLAALGSFLTTSVAVFAFALGVTKTARLRRREQLFREALAVLAQGDRPRVIVSELHLAALSELIARQLTSPWRVVWPWATWLVTVAVSAQIGYEMSRYMDSDAGWDYVDFTTQVFGDTMAPILLPGLVLGAFPQVFYSHLYSLVGRAEVAKNFFDGMSVTRPDSYSQVSMEAYLSTAVPPGQAVTRKDVVQDWKKGGGGRVSSFGWGVTAFASALVPGLFAMSFGLMIGTFVWLERQSGDRTKAIEALGSWPGGVILAFSLLSVAAFVVGTNVALEVRKFALPRVHPRSTLVVSRRSTLEHD